MSLFTHHSDARPVAANKAIGEVQNPAALFFKLYREWDVRRQMAKAQMLDGASLRDIGVAPGGLENAVRHGRGRAN